MRSGRLQHDGNPVLEWCIGNVVGKPDRRGNLYPTRARPEQKIDAAVALVTAIGRSMTEPEQFTSIFERTDLGRARAGAARCEMVAAVKLAGASSSGLTRPVSTRWR